MFIPGQFDPPDTSGHEGRTRSELDPAHASAESLFREARKSAMAHVPRRSSPLAQLTPLSNDASSPPPKPSSAPTKQPSVLRKRPATPPSPSSVRLPTLSIFTKTAKTDKRPVTPPASPSMHITHPRKPGHARSASVPVAAPPVPPIPRTSTQATNSRPPPPSASHDRRQVRLPHPSPGTRPPSRDSIAKSSGAVPLSAREYERLKRQAALPAKPPFGTVPRAARPTAKPSPIARQRTLSVVTEVTDTGSEDARPPGSYPHLRRSRQTIQSRPITTPDSDQPSAKITTTEIALVSPTPERPVSSSSTGSFISCFPETRPSSVHEAATPSFPGALPLPRSINTNKSTSSNEGSLIASAQSVRSAPSTTPPSPSSSHRRSRSHRSSLADVAQRTSRRSLSDAMNRLSHATTSTTRSGDTVFFDAPEDFSEVSSIEDDEPAARTPAHDDVQTIPSERSESEEPLTPESISTGFFIVDHPHLDSFDRSESPGSQRIAIPDAAKINFSLPRTPSPYIVDREEALGAPPERPSATPANETSTASAPRAPTPGTLRRKLTKTRPAHSTSTTSVSRSPSTSSQQQQHQHTKKPASTSLTLPRVGRSGSGSSKKGVGATLSSLGRSGSGGSSHKKPVVLPWITRPASPGSRLPSSNSRSTPPASASSPSLVNVVPLPAHVTSPSLPATIRAPIAVPAAVLEEGKKVGKDKDKAGTVQKRRRRLSFKFLSSKGGSSSQSTPAPVRDQNSSKTTTTPEVTSKATVQAGSALHTSQFPEKGVEKKKLLQVPTAPADDAASTSSISRSQVETPSPKPLNGSITSSSPPSSSSPPHSLEDKSSITKSSSRGPSPLLSPSIISTSSATSAQPSVATTTSTQPPSEVSHSKTQAVRASTDTRRNSPAHSPKPTSATIRASSPPISVAGSRHRRDGSTGSSTGSLHPRRDASVVVVVGDTGTGTVAPGRSPRAPPPSKLKFAVNNSGDARGGHLGSSLQRIFDPVDDARNATVKVDQRSGQQQQQQGRLSAATASQPRAEAPSSPRESKRASGASELQKLFAADERSERGTINSDTGRRRFSVDQELFYPPSSSLAPPRPLRSPARLSSASGSPASLSPARSTTPLAAKRSSTPSPVPAFVPRSTSTSGGAPTRVSPQPPSSSSPPPALRPITPLAIRKKKGTPAPNADSDSSLSTSSSSSTSSVSSSASESIALSSPSRYSQSSAQDLSPWASSPAQQHRGRPRVVRNLSSASKTSASSKVSSPVAQVGGVTLGSNVAAANAPASATAAATTTATAAASASAPATAASADDMHPMWAVPMVTVTNATADVRDLSGRQRRSATIRQGQAQAQAQVQSQAQTQTQPQVQPQTQTQNQQGQGEPRNQQRAKRLPRPQLQPQTQTQDSDVRSLTSTSSRAASETVKLANPGPASGSGPAVYPTGALRGQERQKAAAAAAAAAMRFADSEDIDISRTARSMSPESVRRVGTGTGTVSRSSAQQQRRTDLPGVFAREKAVVHGRF